MGCWDVQETLDALDGAKKDRERGGYIYIYI